MNEVETAMSRFEAALERLNENVRKSMVEIEHRHEQVESQWRDEMRVEYDRRWLPLLNTLEDYRDRVGPVYEEVLLERLRHIGRYLRGY